MNLSVPGYRPPQQVMALEEALKFSPHIVFYTAAGREQWNTISFLADILAEGVEIPYPELKQIVAEAGVSPGMSRPDILQRLKPYDETLLAWVYGRIERLCAADGMRQVWIYLPPLFPTRGEPEERGRARAMAEAAGFEIIDLTGALYAVDVDTLVREGWDSLPNARAPQIITEHKSKALKDPHGHS